MVPFACDACKSPSCPVLRLIVGAYKIETIEAGMVWTIQAGRSGTGTTVSGRHVSDMARLITSDRRRFYETRSPAPRELLSLTGNTRFSFASYTTTASTELKSTSYLRLSTYIRSIAVPMLSTKKTSDPHFRHCCDENYLLYSLQAIETLLRHSRPLYEMIFHDPASKLLLKV